jgi:hypothetical protein
MSLNRPHVSRSDQGGVVTLTLDRPKILNTLSEGMIAELETELAAIAGDTDVRVVVLTGAGPNFCAGHDLKEMRSKQDAEYYAELFERCGRLMLSLLTLPQAVIASVRQRARDRYGGGLPARGHVRSGGRHQGGALRHIGNQRGPLLLRPRGSPVADCPAEAGIRDAGDR